MSHTETDHTDYRDCPFHAYALRVSGDPEFFGFALTQFAARNNLTEAALAAYLGCGLFKLDRLRACGAVRPEHRENDIVEIAAYLGLSAKKLAEVVA